MNRRDEQAHLEAIADRLVDETVARLASMQTELAESVGGVLLRGSRPVPLVDGRRVTSVPGTVVGLSVRETAGAAATLTLRDGDVDGDIVATINLAAAESWTGVLAGPGGVFYAGGLYVELTGAIAGAVYLRGTD